MKRLLITLCLTACTNVPESEPIDIVTTQAPDGGWIFTAPEAKSTDTCYITHHGMTCL